MRIKEGADGLEKYARYAMERGVQRMFFAEMVQPDHIMAGLAGNKFRRAGLQVFEALVSRKVPGIERGPLLQEQLEKHKHFFRDDRHFSDAGKSYIGCLVRSPPQARWLAQPGLAPGRNDGTREGGP